MNYLITKYGVTKNTHSLSEVGRDFLSFGEGQFDVVKLNDLNGNFALRVLHWGKKYMIEEPEFNSFADSQEDAEKEICEKIGQLVVDTDPDSRNWWHDENGAFDAEVLQSNEM